MHVSALYEYPVKSLGGHARTELEPTERGFADDRRWMFTDADGTFITQRQHPGMARFAAATVGESGLRIYRIADGATVWATEVARPTGGNRQRVRVWDDTFSAATVEVPAALGDTLGLPGAGLVYMDSSSNRPVDGRYARHGETVSFADGYPYLITSEESLRDLEARREAPLDMRRFRPNIVVSGATPFAEDDWTGIRIAGHTFYLPKPCARCVMVTHAPDTGERDLRVLSTLAAYRKRDSKVLFGMNALWSGGSGPLRVGDAVALI